MYLVRKVSRAKWDRTDELGDGEIPADAVTADLRTMNNTLSLWACVDDTDRHLNDAILAMVAGAERVDKVEVVWIEQQSFASAGLQVLQSKGRTPVSDLANRHHDVVRLDYGRLGDFAGKIVESLKAGQYRRLTKKRVARLIAAAVKTKRVDLDMLEDKVKQEVQKHL